MPHSTPLSVVTALNTPLDIRSTAVIMVNTRNMGHTLPLGPTTPEYHIATRRPNTYADVGCNPRGRRSGDIAIASVILNVVIIIYSCNLGSIYYV